MGAGEYDDRLEWQKRTPGTKDGVGQRTDTYPSQGYLWGAVDDLSGGRAGYQESNRQTVTATIRVRNHPGVVAGDRLERAGLGEVWTVEHVVRGDNELVCEVTRPRWTAGGGSSQ